MDKHHHGWTEGGTKLAHRTGRTGSTKRLELQYTMDSGISTTEEMTMETEAPTRLS